MKISNSVIYMEMFKKYVLTKILHWIDVTVASFPSQFFFFTKKEVLNHLLEVQVSNCSILVNIRSIASKNSKINLDGVLVTFWHFL